MTLTKKGEKMKTQVEPKIKTLDQQFSEKTGIDVSNKKRGVDLDPVVGMGVTRSIGADSYPYTIIEILKNPKGQTILKIENDSDLYNHDSYTTFKSGRTEKNIKSVHYLIKDKKWVDIIWNEKTKRWNKSASFCYHSIGQRHYKLDPSL
tara:strand:- start:541 stop:987 length:447 start_codon:yes stop_codon:yes gene_type:complete